MSTQWPVVQARLVALLPTLTGFTTPVLATAESDVIVYDGPTMGADATNYVAIGYAEDDKGAGTFTQVPDGSGFFDSETGEVRCELYVGRGDSDAADLTSITASAFALVDTIKAYLAAHRNLATLPAGTTVSLSADVERGISSSGAGVLLLLTFSYVVPIT